MSPDIAAGKRSWVFEALMMLVEKKPYNKITMEDIAKKAGYRGKHCTACLQTKMILSPNF